MTNIFISYRWGDSAGETGRIYDRLKNHFGEDKVFMDVTGTDFGDDIDEIPQKVKQYRVLLAVIGKAWASIKDGSGEKRLNEPNDQVRLEIRTAIENGLSIIPVLVNGARRPAQDKLPEDLVQLTNKKTAPIRHTDFEYDIDALIKRIEGIFQKDAEIERIRIERRENKIKEIEQALSKLNKIDYVQTGELTIWWKGDGKLSADHLLMSREYNERLAVLIGRGWFITTQKIRKGYYLGHLENAWELSHTNLREIAEELIFANDSFGVSVSDIKVVTNDE